MVIFGGCVQTARRGRRRAFDIPASHGEDLEAKRVRFTESRGQKRQGEDVEVVRTILVDVQVPRDGRNRQRR